MKLVGTRVMLSAGVLAALAIAFGVARIPSSFVGAITPAYADDEFVANRWETYTNTRYGVQVDYPADLFAKDWPPPDNAGRNFEAPAVHARFFVYTHANALEQSRDELQEEDVADLGDPAAKKQSGDDWYQIAARRGDEIIVRRVLLSEGATMVHRLEIAFPPRLAGKFAPIVERMTKSFRVDPSIPEKGAEVRDGSAAASRR